MMENVDARDPPRNGGTSTRQCGQGLKLHLISGYPNIIQNSAKDDEVSDVEPEEMIENKQEILPQPDKNRSRSNSAVRYKEHKVHKAQNNVPINSQVHPDDPYLNAPLSMIPIQHEQDSSQRAPQKMQEEIGVDEEMLSALAKRIETCLNSSKNTYDKSIKILSHQIHSLAVDIQSQPKHPNAMEDEKTSESYIIEKIQNPQHLKPALDLDRDCSKSEQPNENLKESRYMESNDDQGQISHTEPHETTQAINDWSLNVRPKIDLRVNSYDVRANAGGLYSEPQNEDYSRSVSAPVAETMNIIQKNGQHGTGILKAAESQLEYPPKGLETSSNDYVNERPHNTTPLQNQIPEQLSTNQENKKSSATKKEQTYFREKRSLESGRRFNARKPEKTQKVGSIETTKSSIRTLMANPSNTKKKNSPQRAEKLLSRSPREKLSAKAKEELTIKDSQQKNPEQLEPCELNSQNTQEMSKGFESVDPKEVEYEKYLNQKKSSLSPEKSENLYGKIIDDIKELTHFEKEKLENSKIKEPSPLLKSSNVEANREIWINRIDKDVKVRILEKIERELKKEFGERWNEQEAPTNQLTTKLEQGLRVKTETEGRRKKSTSRDRNRTSKIEQELKAAREIVSRVSRSRSPQQKSKSKVSTNTAMKYKHFETEENNSQEKASNRISSNEAQLGNMQVLLNSSRTPRKFQTSVTFRSPETGKISNRAQEVQQPETNQNLYSQKKSPSQHQRTPSSDEKLRKALAKKSRETQVKTSAGKTSGQDKKSK